MTKIFMVVRDGYEYNDSTYDPCGYETQYYELNKGFYDKSQAEEVADKLNNEVEKERGEWFITDDGEPIRPYHVIEAIIE